MSKIEEILARQTELATLSDSVLAVLRIFEDPSVSAGELVPVVERDPGLTANLLKLCNSPVYRFSRKVGTVREALVLVGNKVFLRMVLALGMQQVIRRRLTGYGMSMDSLWNHSLTVGFVAGQVVKDLGEPLLGDRAFTAGLLHDTGKVILDEELSQQDQIEPSFRGPACLALEKGVTGLQHPEVGGALLQKWNLPEEIVQAVTHHHREEGAPDRSQVEVAVYCANEVSHLLTGDYSESRRESVIDSLKRLGLSEEVLFHLLDSLTGKTEEIASLALGPA